MAGEYGEIDSRLAFHRILAETISMVQRKIQENPNWELMQLLFEELDAMRRWSVFGREPTNDERANINVGLLAARELSSTAGNEAVLVNNLLALNNYFEDWPSDEQAATAPDAAPPELT